MGQDPEREKLDAMAARIREAESKPTTEALSTSAAPMKVSRIGFDFMAAILVCTFVGWLVDKTLDTKPWGLMFMVLMGFAIGITNVWRALSSPKSE